MEGLRLSQPDPPYRRLMGVVLGGASGLVSQWINRVYLPGAPLYQPPFGPAGNSLLFALGGALLGQICAWPTGGVQGTFLASALSAPILVGGNFATARPCGNMLIRHRGHRRVPGAAVSWAPGAVPGRAALGRESSGGGAAPAPAALSSLAKARGVGAGSEPGRNLDNHQFVVARFTDGRSLASTLITLDEAPLCHGFTQLPP